MMLTEKFIKPPVKFMKMSDVVIMMLEKLMRVLEIVIKSLDIVIMTTEKLIMPPVIDIMVTEKLKRVRFAVIMGVNFTLLRVLNHEFNELTIFANLRVNI